MFDNSKLDDCKLTTDDFHRPAFKSIFGLMQKLHDERIEINMISLNDICKKHKVDIDHSIWSPETAVNFYHYQELLKESSNKIKLTKLYRNIAIMLEDQKDSSEILADIEKRITDFTGKDNSEYINISDVLMDTVDNLEKHYQSKGNMRGIETGFRELDDILTGYKPGTLNIIAARPGIGKTAISLNMALNMSLKNIKVGFFSLEMDRISLAERLLSSMSRINMHYFKNGVAKEIDFVRLQESCGELYQKYLYIDDSPNIDLYLLKSRARKMKRQGVQILFVDYITLIKCKMNAAKHEIVDHISKSLKQLARELNVPIVAMSQVGRQADGRLPVLADIRASGSIEEDADTVSFLHRKADQTVFDVAKHRQGCVGKVDLLFEPEYSRFKEC
jgi:replicative DNA helicase